MSTVKCNDLTNVTGGIPTVKSQQLIPTAWINFNGKTTVAINASENVSSLVDIGVGRWRIYFATTMSNSNYAVVGTACEASAQGNGGAGMVYTWTHTTSDFYLQCLDYQGSYSDEEPMSSIVMGGQA
tara:strand:+ start:461 stop:841 length:381 start_codon:yes stop_codon:yes gene_type:complete